ncbi:MULTISPECIES: lipocalin-like domain-containing protein [unclassified Diaminobutyricimonas]|uniref:lipocalin-like domain-containing protein n=1 Tax=unclassified Diaminobutyricimonas TaxID=2643261 RepID=UPI0018DF5BB4|nr:MULTISPECIES: lipocalin-like domain-containing protein [unclassified Diaminobutyricimonas]
MNKTAMTAEELRNTLIGAWNLVSYVECPTDGSADRHPLGEDPMGIIMYTPDGFMSAQLMNPERKPVASGDWFNVTESEAMEKSMSYIAYSGPFEVSDEALTHGMTVSMFPNWIGQTQPRVVETDGKNLHLSTAVPIMSGGVEVNSYLTWERAAA